MCTRTVHTCCTDSVCVYEIFMHDGDAWRGREIETISMPLVPTCFKPHFAAVDSLAESFTPDTATSDSPASFSARSGNPRPSAVRAVYTKSQPSEPQVTIESAEPLSRVPSFLL